MELWVLIYFIKVGYGAGTAAVEFPTQAACETAGKAVEREFNVSMGGAKYVCVRKPAH